MTRVVGHVMCQGAESERILVDIVRVAKHCLNEVCASNVVRQVCEQMRTHRVITHVLHDASAIGIGTSLLQILRSCAREPLQQNLFYGILPHRIDDGFMRENGVRLKSERNQQQDAQESSSAERAFHVLRKSNSNASR